MQELCREQGIIYTDKRKRLKENMLRNYKSITSNISRCLSAAICVSGSGYFILIKEPIERRS